MASHRKPFNRNFRFALLNMQLLARISAPDRPTLSALPAQGFHGAGVNDRCIKAMQRLFTLMSVPRRCVHSVGEY